MGLHKRSEVQKGRVQKACGLFLLWALTFLSHELVLILRLENFWLQGGNKNILKGAMRESAYLIYLAQEQIFSPFSPYGARLALHLRAIEIKEGARTSF